MIRAVELGKMFSIEAVGGEMDYFERTKFGTKTASKWLCVPLLLLTSACDSSLVREAKRAESDGNVINNEIMLNMYPQTFRPGSPEYLERDFEAGADFICAEIRAKYDRDMCSEPQINWK